jgi:hypothetical protein
MMQIIIKIYVDEYNSGGKLSAFRVFSPLAIEFGGCVGVNNDC